MTEQDFTLTFTLDPSPQAVFEAVVAVREWWSQRMVGDAEKAGDMFTYEVPGIHRVKAEVVEAIPGRRVVWRVVDSWLDLVEDKTEWNGTEIRFEIDETEGKTELRFTHAGLVPEFECFDACRKGWNFYIGKSLRDRITTGTGLPDDDPQTHELSAQQTTSRH